MIYTFNSVNNCLVFQVRITSADHGRVIGELTVEEEHQNRGGTLHGGLTATMVDNMTTLALLSMEDGQPGVSVDLNIT